MWLQAAGSQYSSVNTAEFSDFSDLDGQEDDSIDPRVQEELERLNNATDDINKLEVELDDSRAAFRQLLSDSSQRINTVAKKIGSSVEKARPYYDARMKAKQAHTETQKAALRFERANSAHAAAKEMVFLAEEGLQKDGRTFDPAWQEMLNHATIRVNEAERERTLSEQEHRKTSTAYNQVDAVVKDYMKELKKHISKSRPYFEMKAEFNKRMEEQKRRVQELEESVLKSKMSYADALHNLEEISDEIHQRRKRQEERRALGQRGHGVGAEHPEPSSKYRPHPGEVAHPQNDEEYMELPNSLRLNKSLSSSTISQMLVSQSKDDRQARYASRLKKSKSVADRSEASPLFGRYSISRRNRLQVDHASQTDAAAEDEAPVLLDVSVDSSSVSSIQSSGSTSPLGGATFGSVNRRGVCLLPNLMATSYVSDNGDVSDTESLASIDVLSDEQIASLMMDKELEDVAQSLRVRVRINDAQEEDQRSRNITTQTNAAATEGLPVAGVVPIVAATAKNADGKSVLTNGAPNKAELTSPNPSEKRV